MTAMKHLIDDSEPITLEDIAQAQRDADHLLCLGGHAALSPAVASAMERLLAIVDEVCGRPL